MLCYIQITGCVEVRFAECQRKIESGWEIILECWRTIYSAPYDEAAFAFRRWAGLCVLPCRRFTRSINSSAFARVAPWLYISSELASHSF